MGPPKYYEVIRNPGSSSLFSSPVPLRVASEPKIIVRALAIASTSQAVYSKKKEGRMKGALSPVSFLSGTFVQVLSALLFTSH